MLRRLKRHWLLSVALVIFLLITFQFSNKKAKTSIGCGSSGNILVGEYSVQSRPCRVDRKTLLVDTILFSTEYETLKHRIEYLRDHMDYFVVIQSNVTFSGLSKPLVLSGDLEAQIRRTLRHEDQLLVYNLYLPPGRKNEVLVNAWHREERTREALYPVVRDNLPILDTDLMFVTDLDEIPNPDYLDVLRTMADEGSVKDVVYSIHMNMYYYNFGCRDPVMWKKATVCNFRTIFKSKSVNIQRRASERQANLSGNRAFTGVKGWHLTYGMSIDSILDKISSFSHQELNTPELNNRTHIEECIRECKNWFDPSIKFIKGYNATELPKNYQKIENMFQKQ